MNLYLYLTFNIFRIFTVYKKVQNNNQINNEVKSKNDSSSMKEFRCDEKLNPKFFDMKSSSNPQLFNHSQSEIDKNLQSYDIKNNKNRLEYMSLQQDQSINNGKNITYVKHIRNRSMICQAITKL